jgi:hypothetical protein
MWMEKLAGGVLQIATPVGPRYLRLSFRERVQFLWVFRHFSTLPQMVLSRRVQARVEALCARQHFVMMPHGVDAPVIGILERTLPQASGLPPRRPVVSAAEASVHPFAADSSR